VFDAIVAAMPTRPQFLLPALLSLSVAAAMTAAPEAGANGRPPPNSAVEAYVEQLPSSSGPQVPDATQKPTRVAPSVARGIKQKGGSDTNELMRIVASPTSGADTTATRPAASDGRATTRLPQGVSLGRSLSASVNAVGSGSRVAWLLVVLLSMTTVAALGFAARQRHMRVQTQPADTTRH
jgi:hypothetical protein